MGKDLVAKPPPLSALTEGARLARLVSPLRRRSRRAARQQASARDCGAEHLPRAPGPALRMGTARPAAEARRRGRGALPRPADDRPALRRPRLLHAGRRRGGARRNERPGLAFPKRIGQPLAGWLAIAVGREKKTPAAARRARGAEGHERKRTRGGDRRAAGGGRGAAACGASRRGAALAGRHGWTQRTAASGLDRGL
jgi:hypothetical protein